MNILCLIKADAKSRLTEISHAITQVHKLHIHEIYEHQLTKDQVAQIYGEHRHKYFYPILEKYMCLEPIFGLVIDLKDTAISTIKTSLREQFPPLDVYTSCLEHILQNRDELISDTFELAAFKEEFFRTFDTIHMSDADRAKAELDLFKSFDPKPLTASRLFAKTDAPTPMSFINMIKHKVSAQNQVSGSGASLFSMRSESLDSTQEYGIENSPVNTQELSV